MSEVSCTERIIDTINAMGPNATEKATLKTAIYTAVQLIPQGGWIDSHKVARAIMDRRYEQNRPVTFEQTRDYVQHMFREAEYVCRHADGHHYRLHQEKVCSPECDEIYLQNPKIVVREHCQFCFLELSTAGECPMGC